jgi:hypothetical protein
MKLHEIYDSDPVVINLHHDNNYSEFVSTIDSEVFKIRITNHSHIPNLKYTSIDFSKKDSSGEFTMALRADSKIATVTSLIAAIRKCYNQSGYNTGVIIGSIQDNHGKREKFYKLLLRRFGAKRVDVLKSTVLGESTLVYGILDDSISTEDLTKVLQDYELK